MHDIHVHRITTQRCFLSVIHNCSVLLVEAPSTLIDCKNCQRSCGISLRKQCAESFLKQAGADSMPCEGWSTVQIVDKGQGGAPDGYETQELLVLFSLGDEDNISLADLAVLPLIPDIVMQPLPHIVGRQNGAVARGPAVCL